MHNKNQNPLLNLLINCIFARSLKGEYSFRFSNFVVIGLCNSPTILGLT